MTLAQAIALRDAAYTAMLAALQSGGVAQYTAPGASRSVTKNLEWLSAQYEKYSAAVAQMSGGGFFAAEFRNPE